MDADDYYYYADDDDWCDNSAEYEEPEAAPLVEGTANVVAVLATADADLQAPQLAAEEAALSVVLNSDRLHTIDPSVPFKLLMRDVGRLASLFHVSEQFALLLLARYNFSVETASEAFVTDPDAVFSGLHLTRAVAHSNNTFTPLSSSGGDDESAMCEVCCFENGEAAGNRLLKLSGCGHVFCLGCWTDYVRLRVRDNGSVLNLRCMMSGCAELVNVRAILDLLPEDLADEAGGVGAAEGNNEGVEANGSKTNEEEEGEKAEKAGAAPVARSTSYLLRRALLTQYVNGSPRLSWCANPHGCERILFVPPAVSSSSRLLTCPDCRFPFCGRCRLLAHAPASCAEFEGWMARLALDGASLARIMEQTKPCPQCRSRIEKNQGCNHMTCRCKFEFCWICGTDWTKHQGDSFNCRASNKDSFCGKDLTKDEAKAKLFFDFYQGYDAHLGSLKEEDRILAKAASMIPITARKQEMLFEHIVSERRLETVIAELRHVLMAARNSLSATYVHGYYYALAHGAQSEDAMSLHRRNQLMKETERLNQMLFPLVNAASGVVDLNKIEVQADLVSCLTKPLLI